MKSNETRVRRMVYQKWADKYKPIRNSFDSSAAIDGCLFQPYGEQWEFVKVYDSRKIWTLVITDLQRSTIWEITSGIHIVNRFGFLITEIPIEGQGVCDVRY